MDIPVKSAIQGIDWPAVPANASACRLAGLLQLEQTQWWPEARLRQQQFRQLDALLRHAVQHVPYYRDLLGGAIGRKSITEDQWAHIPLLTRDRLQQAADKLYAEKLPNGHGRVGQIQTSGSTGKPVKALNTGITTFFWNVFTLRDHLWHNRDLGRKLAVIRYNQHPQAKPPDGVQARNWGPATSGVCDTGICSQLSIHTPIAEQLKWLLKQSPDYLLTHPSVLQELAMRCQRENLTLPTLREVRTISEALPDDLRELCRDVWGVKLVDAYSTIELGYLALQCPEHEHYHVQSEGVFLEVLDDAGKPCAAGEVGKVVVTNLHNFASPLIRYEVGDYAEVGEACSCGRGLPVIKRIMGRYRNLITLPDGERRWPKFGMQKILQIAPVLQFQAIQHSIHDVEFLLVSKRSLTDTEVRQLTALFKSNLHPEMNVSIRSVDEIPRSQSGKYEEFVSKL